LLAEFGLSANSNKIEIFHGVGCQNCKFTGYRGRTAIYEIIRIGEEIRQMIIRKRSSQEIKKKAMQLGMKTLFQDGWRKVCMGLTTLDEVVRVTQKEMEVE